MYQYLLLIKSFLITFFFFINYISSSFFFTLLHFIVNFIINMVILDLYYLDIKSFLTAKKRSIIYLNLLNYLFKYY